jgi:N-formylglutamate amidohydrolase
MHNHANNGRMRSVWNNAAKQAAAPTAKPDAAEAPFLLIEPLRKAAPLIFASPHSGRRYPREMLQAAQVGLHSLRRGEDAYVDELFAGASKHGASVLCATFARSFIDLNRDPNELDPDMFAEALPAHANTGSARVQAGLGAIPKIAGDGRTIYRGKLSLAEVEQRIAAIYLPYHSALARLIAEAQAAFGCAVLIDCHSMPSCARGPHAPDIVLGDRYGAACHPSVISLVEASLRRLGYKVARNAPFAGGHTTQNYGRPADRVHGLQIEVSRGLYLDEHNLERASGFAKVKADMSRLAETLAAAELHRSLA